MSNSKFIIYVICSLFLFTIPLHSQDLYKDKVLAVAVVGTDHGAYIKDPKMEEYLKINFLTGTVINTPVHNTWNTGKKILIPVEKISNITVFNTVEEFQDTIKNYYIKQ